MKHHKDKALEKECLCNGCEFKFQCFTQERVFSDPIFQGLFEALMAKGRTKEEALEEVTNELKLRIPGDTGDSVLSPWIAPLDGTGVTIDMGNYTISSSNGYVTYTLDNGEEISWSAKTSDFK